jgi:hypothetical protein
VPIRTPGYEIAASLRASAADKASQVEARRVVERWNKGNARFANAAHYFCVRLKYCKSGGAWFFLDGISLPSALR